MENVLTTHALTKEYRHTQALAGVDMHIPQGSIYGFVGKNGAGKTTLIRIITGLQHPTSGDYTLYGLTNTDPKILDARRRVGAVVESPAFYGGLSAKENLIQQCDMLGVLGKPDIDGILETVGLHDTGKKRASRFSLGMKQRLGIALALCGSPDFLILDEPANGLDPQGIIEIRQLILSLNRDRGVTILMSSHNLDELAKVATCYGFIDGGRMVREITAQEIQDQCRKCLSLRVSNTSAFARTMDELGISYRVLSDNEVEVFDEPEITDLVSKLAKNGCDVLSITEKGQTLEAYYLNLIGGGKDEQTAAGRF